MVNVNYDTGYQSLYEQWGSTPLNLALIVAHDIIKKFKMKHSVEKMNLVCLTDGDTNPLRIYQDSKLEHLKSKIEYGYHRGMNITLDGKTINLPDSYKHGTKALLENIKNVEINKKPRSKSKPSDHTPIELEII